jgi:hypothetical protein
MLDGIHIDIELCKVLAYLYTISVVIPHQLQPTSYKPALYILDRKIIRISVYQFRFSIKHDLSSFIGAVLLRPRRLRFVRIKVHLRS